jgi:hypothetical protein
MAAILRGIWREALKAVLYYNLPVREMYIELTVLNCGLVQ